MFMGKKGIEHTGIARKTHFHLRQPLKLASLRLTSRYHIFCMVPFSSTKASSSSQEHSSSSLILCLNRVTVAASARKKAVSKNKDRDPLRAPLWNITAATEDPPSQRESPNPILKFCLKKIYCTLL